MHQKDDTYVNILNLNYIYIYLTNNISPNPSEKLIK